MLVSLGVQGIFARGVTDRKGWQSVNSYGELPGSLVIVSPLFARDLPGEIALQDFHHPDECTYVFGASDGRLLAADFDGLNVSARIYIPTLDCNQVPQTAAAMVFWDRFTKRGAEFG